MSKPFISEKIIDAKAAEITADDVAIINSFREQQPAVLAYLFSESFQILTQEEHEYLLYQALVILQSCLAVFEEIEELSAEEFEDTEERNWAVFTDAPGKDFRTKLDVFFKDYQQEDLLAFVEDSLVISEEGEEKDDFEVTKEGREPIFIALKTLIDCLTR